jgi:dipeptidyl-peptidase-3
MRQFTLWGLLLFGLVLVFGCGQEAVTTDTDAPVTTETTEDFVWSPESFADKKIIRYQVPGFDQLNLDQKKLVYFLTQAGLSGRDIMWDMNYRHNLVIRDVLEHIVRNYEGDKESDDWQSFMLYVKNVWFSNGIHHHYSTDKFIPDFSQEYFMGLVAATGAEMDEALLPVMFDPTVDAKKINLDPENDLLLGSAINFYDPTITEEEVDAFYAELVDPSDETPVSYGLNSRMVRGEDGKIREEAYKVDGQYGPAIAEIIKWLEKAVEVAENEPQREALKLLVKYYQTGDLKVWDDYNIAWVQATEGDIDYINGFIEVYNDPKGYRGSYETIVQIKDFEASRQMQIVAENAQWFESESPIMDEHKKENVVGISYNVVVVAGEAGDASPATPIGVNLPNANWIRAKQWIEVC